MSDLLIPDVDDALRARLKARAQLHRRSLEDEVRQTLRDAVGLNAELPGPDESVADVFLRIFGPENGVELDIPPRSADRDRPPPDFGGPDGTG